MKQCPFCAESIQDAALVCRFCGRDLPREQPEATVDPHRPTGAQLAVIVVVVLVGIAAAMSSFTSAPDAGAQAAGLQNATTPTSAPPQAAPVIEVTAWRFYNEHGYHFIEGQVRNLGNTPIEDLVAVGSFLDSTGGFVKSNDAFVEYRPLLPGQSSPFKVMTSMNPAVNRASITFKRFMGGVLEHRDSSKR